MTAALSLLGDLYRVLLWTSQWVVLVKDEVNAGQVDVVKGEATPALKKVHNWNSGHNEEVYGIDGHRPWKNPHAIKAQQADGIYKKWYQSRHTYPQRVKAHVALRQEAHITECLSKGKSHCNSNNDHEEDGNRELGLLIFYHIYCQTAFAPLYLLTHLEKGRQIAFVRSEMGIFDAPSFPYTSLTPFVYILAKPVLILHYWGVCPLSLFCYHSFQPGCPWFQVLYIKGYIIFIGI